MRLSPSIVGPGLAVLLCIARDTSAGGPGPGAALRSVSSSVVVLSADSGNGQLDGQLLAESVVELDRLSPTFRDMLETLDRSRIRTFLAASPQLQRQAGLIGRTRLVVTPAGIVAFAEAIPSRDDPGLRRRAIAHELAHVVEVACLGAVRHRDELRRKLTRQPVSLAGARGNDAIETPFAQAATLAVLREVASGRPMSSQLAQLARHAGLPACPGAALETLVEGGLWFESEETSGV